MDAIETQRQNIKIAMQAVADLASTSFEAGSKAEREYFIMFLKQYKTTPEGLAIITDLINRLSKVEND